MDSVFLNNEESSRLERSNFSSSNIPTWRMPLSKSYSSGLRGFLYPGESEITPNQERDSAPAGYNNDPFKSSSTSGNFLDDDDNAQTIIQILLPCIICNRTFSPEALERHSKICTRVRENDKRLTRPTFDSAVQRIKNTKIADFIPPPPEYSQNDSCFTRNSRMRNSFQGSPTRSSFGKGSTSSAPWRRQRASSTPKTFFNDNDNYGLDPESTQSPEEHGRDYDQLSITEGNNASNLPSYARALSPTDDCPYCLRSFGLKAYDRHVSFCKEVWERRQYEVQPTPVELHEARERQEIRTKYKPMKGSNSCSSLRSGSPPKDTGSRSFASAALNKLFGGLKRTENRTLFRTPDRMKKSSESLTSSCYGDFARNAGSMRIRQLPSPSDSRFGYMGKGGPMQINMSGNLPKKTKSTDSLASAHSVQSSGYGPGGSYLNNFSRNSKTRSSLNNNFFRSKRVEPEGTENTSNGSGNNNNPLIITPMNYYNKQRSESTPSNEYDSLNKSTMFNSDSKYDPYEKAAKQLEELLRTQPLLHKNSKSNRTQRRIGIDRALASVNPSSSIQVPDSNKDDTRRTSLNSIGNGFGNKSAKDQHQPGRYATEDSYWEAILNKKSRPRDEMDDSRDHRDSIQLSDSSEPTSTASGSGNDNQQQKSRAVSNISSADSAYSRSDGIDLEFEALETLVTKSFGNVPSGGTTTSTPKSSDLMSSRNPPMMMTSFVSKPISQQEEDEEEEQIKTTGSSNKGCGLTPTPAKFCHQCGTSYPTTASKFCPECGERRVINV